MPGRLIRSLRRLARGAAMTSVPNSRAGTSTQISGASVPARPIA